MTIVCSCPRSSVHQLAICRWLHAASPKTTPPPMLPRSSFTFRGKKMHQHQFPEGFLALKLYCCYFNSLSDKPPSLTLNQLPRCREGSLGAERTRSQNTAVQVPDPPPKKRIGKAGRGGATATGAKASLLLCAQPPAPNRPTQGPVFLQRGEEKADPPRRRRRSAALWPPGWSKVTLEPLSCGRAPRSPRPPVPRHSLLSGLRLAYGV